MKRALLVALIVAGCSTAREPRPVVWFGNPAKVWALHALQGERVMERPGYVATVRFNADHSVSGTMICNSISSAKLQWSGAEGKTHGTFDQAGHGAGIITTADCGDPAAYAVAGRFWNLLETARSWAIHEDGLTITFDDGSGARLTALSR